MALNVELKATDPGPAASLALCHALGAEDRGLLRQRDTYFAAGDGERLKLREQPPDAPQLIRYRRADAPEQRTSRYEIEEAPDVAALGEPLCVVDKLRRLFLWRGVRIHLDRVEGLGSFIELEAVAAAGSDLSAEHALVRELREAFAITDERLVPVGYAALLSAARPGRRAACRGSFPAS